MKIAQSLRALGRGVKLAVGVLRAELASKSPSPAAREPAETVEFAKFGDNPGRLRMLAFVPGLHPGPPLIVLLHGCTQDAATFAAETGWTGIAERHGIPLVLPEQRETNNRHRYFQWFQPHHTARGAGEAGSIASMTQWAIQRFGSDPTRVFIVGLSAGGAMAASMLAAYPDLFSAGAVVAGLPVGAADSATRGLMRMARAGPERSAEAWAAQVRHIAPAGYDGRWPRLSVWHGGGDRAVAPDNSELLALQWRTLHALGDKPSQDTERDGARHRRWGEGERPPIELWTMPGQPHGYPVGPAVTRLGSFMLTTNVNATSRIAEFLGLGGARQ